MNYYTRHDCRLCKSKNISNVMHLEPTPIGDDFIEKSKIAPQEIYPLDLVFCNECGFLQIPNVVSPELLYKNYIYETNSSLNLAEHFNNYAQSIVKFLSLSPGSTIFEVGCNDGTFLNAFHVQKMNAIGIEPATRIAKKAADKGLQVINDFFSSKISSTLVSKYGNADLICANNVLANIDDLDDFFKTISGLIKNSGAFIFESGYMIDLILNDVIDNIYHEHLSYFSVYPLSKKLQTFGLELFHVEHVNTKGGSMRYFIQKIGARAINQSVKKYLDYEISNGFNSANRFTDLAKKHAGEREKLISFLKEQKAQGKKIAGFGASVGVTTLLYYYGISEYIDFLADDNTNRHGLYSPGKHLPVVSPQKLYDENYDFAVCFPWRYLVPIKNRHEEFLKSGGKFILPLPEFKIVGNDGI